MKALKNLIMKSVMDWTKTQKGPIPMDKILLDLETSDADFTEDSVKYHVRALVKKGNLRKACIRTKKTYYVFLRAL